MTTKEQIIELLDNLNEYQQREVLRAVLAITNRPKGTSGKRAIEIAREIGFSHEDLAEMQQAIEEAGENIDPEPDVKFDD